MEIQNIPEPFRPYEDYYRAIYKEGKLCFVHYSTFLLFICLVLGVLLFGLLWALLNTFIIKWHDNPYVYYVIFSLYIVAFIVCCIKINVFSVIDYKNSLFYKEFNVFGKSFFKFGFIKLEDIVKVANNIVPQYCNPEGKNNRVKVNEKTNLYHKYVVSFFVNNGDIVNFLELGGFVEDYYKSIDIAKSIGTYWNIPTVFCKNNQKLHVISTKDGEGFILERVTIPESYLRDFAVIISFFILISLIFLT